MFDLFANHAARGFIILFANVSLCELPFMRRISFPPFIGLILLTFATAFLLFLSWTPQIFTALGFIALVPLFFLSEKAQSQNIFAGGYYLLSFFLFHLLAGWWMYSSTIVGSFMAHFFNAFIMMLVFLAWDRLKQNVNTVGLKELILVALWLGFELLQQHWDLAWPWFSLGNLWAAQPEWVQWYSFTGVAGGSLWVLVVNVLVYHFVKALIQKQIIKWLTMMGITLVFIFVPILISKQIRHTNDHDRLLKVLIVQPNIHPQKEKFAGLSAKVQVQRAITIAKSNHFPKADLMVFPETMLVDAVDENNPELSVLLKMLRDSLIGEESTSLLSGAFSKRFNKWHSTDNEAVVYDSLPFVLYNSAFFIQEKSLQIYHKQKLVPLVEKQPFQQWMRPLQKYVEQSGGFFGRYGTYNQQQYFTSKDSTIIYPLICFESAFSTDFSASRNNKASLMVLITNDGWWSSSGGYVQHLAMARLRAIETGLWVARCANTGVSAVIDPSGNIIQSAAYGHEATLFAEIPLLKPDTFFVRYQKIIEMSPLFFLLITFLWATFDQQFWQKTYLYTNKKYRS